MHKCDCNNADCDIFNGTCTCWDEYTGINCEEKILSKNYIIEPENPEGHKPILFVIPFGLLVTVAVCGCLFVISRKKKHRSGRTRAIVPDVFASICIWMSDFLLNRIRIKKMKFG
jgi:hypothetical protein